MTIHNTETASLHETQKYFSDLLFVNQEYSSPHNPYDRELREVAAIEAGDIEQLEQALSESPSGQIGTLAKTSLRHCQNLGIVIVTLASRAAMRGGVHHEIAYSLSDSYINQLEEARTPEAALKLGRQAQIQYALLVKELLEQRKITPTNTFPDSRISKCKDYIFSHLHEKISINEIADALQINANYLSGLFKKKEGLTISEYILHEKIKLVKNMLIYSEYSYIEIASYLGFCSQSHLGAKFKKITGMTLRQFREQYGMKEFQAFHR